MLDFRAPIRILSPMTPLTKTWKLLIVAGALAAGLALNSCNTVSGVGQDVQRAGSALENASGH